MSEVKIYADTSISFTERQMIDREIKVMEMAGQTHGWVGFGTLYRMSSNVWQFVRDSRFQEAV